jgi:hypothetical protein
VSVFSSRGRLIPAFWGVVEPYRKSQTATWSATRQTVTFDTGADPTSGLQGSSDKEDDSDLDVELLHEEFGDGFTAFDEYRGLKVQGMIQRVNEMVDDGPLQVQSGPQLKDVYVFADDDTGTWALGNLFPAENTYLGQFGMSWHKLIVKDEMPGYVEGDEPKAGIANSGPPVQPAVWLMKDDNLGGGARMGETLGVIAHRNPIRINPVAIKAFAVYWEVNRLTVLKHTVAHELGHILWQKHHEAKRTYVSGKPDDPTFDVYRPVDSGNQKVIEFWIPMSYKVGEGPLHEHPLEKYVGFEGTNALVTDHGNTTQEESQVGGVHTVAHRVMIRRLEFANDTDISLKIKLESHTGNMMDVYLDYTEMPGVQALLTNTQKEKLRVR